MKISIFNYSQTLVYFLSMSILACCVAACSQAEKSELAEESITAVEEEGPNLEDEPWVIHEHQINHVPLTSKAETAPSTEQNEAEETEGMDEAYQIYTVDMVEEEFLEIEYEPLETVSVTEMVIPLSETQTVTSYSKKGKAKGDTLQVISSGDGEIEQIIFTHKKHKDTYDVRAGMSGKEVKKLRKELKHMVKHGQVFLYDEASNIMYLMDVQDAMGNEVTYAEIDTMEVQAIIWKDKKHHNN
ncbi:hypothetical protein WJR50_16650 [Catalinimonas sp. 4WD22]|uniref:hypothetical protein n=1 Tax=Catalinimonas locisalis TaxID=3133978 RepID=UPI003101B24E